MSPPEPGADAAAERGARANGSACFQLRPGASVRGPALWDAIDTLIAALGSRWRSGFWKSVARISTPSRDLQAAGRPAGAGWSGTSARGPRGVREAEAPASPISPASWTSASSGALALAAQLLRNRAGPRHAASAARCARMCAAAARAACRRTSLQAAPFVFADAVRALQIPGARATRRWRRTSRRAATVLAARLRRGRAAAGITRARPSCSSASRAWRPTTCEVSGTARSKQRAKRGRPARELDTLTRIHAIRRDSASSAPCLRSRLGAVALVDRWRRFAGRRANREPGQPRRCGGRDAEWRDRRDRRPGDCDDRQAGGAKARSIRPCAWLGRRRTATAVRLASAPAAATADRRPCAAYAAAADPTRRGRRGWLRPSDARSRGRRRHAPARPPAACGCAASPRQGQPRGQSSSATRTWRPTGGTWARRARELGETRAGADACVVRAWLIEPREEERAA